MSLFYSVLILAVCLSLNTMASPIREWESPEVLFQDYYVKTALAELPQEGEVLNKPWAGWLWPMSEASMANRYTDKGFPQTPVFGTYSQYLKQNPAIGVYYSRQENEINKLSPLEKYELLIGETNSGLVNSILELAMVYKYDLDTVQNWAGFCDGLAGASTVFERPVRAIEVPSRDGSVKIKFYPDDIKALGALLMSSSQDKKLQLGNQCYSKNPVLDSNGRIDDIGCGDPNSGAFHIALVNKVGLQKRPLIIDKTYSFEVWNFPVTSFEYEFQNPLTKEKADTLQEALVRVSDLGESDPFRDSRAKETKFIVNIQMTVNTTKFMRPSAKNILPAKSEGKQVLYYSYDLELDENKNIIGGEWHEQRNHPDFLWVFIDGAAGKNQFDRELLDSDFWNGIDPIPEKISATAIKAVEKGALLQYVVRQLFDLSKQKN